jgi:hypothetical protein
MPTHCNSDALDFGSVEGRAIVAGFDGGTMPLPRGRSRQPTGGARPRAGVGGEFGRARNGEGGACAREQVRARALSNEERDHPCVIGPDLAIVSLLGPATGVALYIITISPESASTRTTKRSPHIDANPESVSGVRSVTTRPSM